MAFAATENGVRGVKIHWRHVVSLARTLGFRGDPGVVLEVLFPAAVFVNIVRADRRAQALSLFRAETTGGVVSCYRLLQQGAPVGALPDVARTRAGR